MQFMQVITSLLLAAFAGYIGAWYFGALEGNFALLLFLATVVTGVYWLGERFYFLPQRRKAAQALEDAAVQRVPELDRMGIQKVDVDAQEAKKPHPHAALVAGLDGGPLSRDRGCVRAALIPL
jgi:signal peptidase I